MTKPTKPAHIDTCEACARAAREALAFARDLAREILAASTRPLPPGDRAALDRAAHEVAALAVEMAGAFALMDALMSGDDDDHDDNAAHDARDAARAATLN